MRLYSESAGPLVPPLQRERRDRLLAWLRAWLRDDMGPMTVDEIVDCCRVYGPLDLGVARKDLNQLERYGLVRRTGHPNKWSARKD